MQCGGIQLVILGNANTFQTPQNFTMENNQVLLDGALGFGFASLLLFYYFLLLIFNGLVKTAHRVGKTWHWVISWNFPKALWLSQSTRGRNFTTPNTAPAVLTYTQNCPAQNSLAFPPRHFQDEHTYDKIMQRSVCKLSHFPFCFPSSPAPWLTWLFELLTLGDEDCHCHLGCVYPVLLAAGFPPRHSASHHGTC